MAESDQSELLAIRALSFLASETDRLERFLKLSGLGPDTIRRDAESPAFLKGVLEYLLEDESLLMVFCAETGIRPEDVSRAVRNLDQQSVANR